MVMIMTMGKIVKMVTMVRMVTMVMMENIRKILKIMKMKTSTDQDENLKYKLNCVFLFLITNRFFFTYLAVLEILWNSHWPPQESTTALHKCWLRPKTNEITEVRDDTLQTSLTWKLIMSPPFLLILTQILNLFWIRYFFNHQYFAHGWWIQNIPWTRFKAWISRSADQLLYWKQGYMWT